MRLLAFRKRLSIYFPERKDVYKKPDAKSGMMVIKKAPLPADIKELGVDGVNKIGRASCRERV